METDWHIETFTDPAGKWAFTAQHENVTLMGNGYDTEQDALIDMRDKLSAQAGKSEPEKPKREENPTNYVMGFLALAIGLTLIGFMVFIGSQVLALVNPIQMPISEACQTYHDCTPEEAARLPAPEPPHEHTPMDDIMQQITPLFTLLIAIPIAGWIVITVLGVIFTALEASLK